MELVESRGECFVICPIGQLGSQERNTSDKVLRHLISPVVEELGYKAVRADQISEPGIITSQVIQHLVDSSLVVADLSGHNPNVFYELAIRHAYGKPLVQLITRGQSMPFDVSVMRTIQYELSDPDLLSEAKDELRKQILSLQERKGHLDTPISIAVDLEVLKGGNPQQRSLADVIEAVSGLSKEVSTLRTFLLDVAGGKTSFVSQGEAERLRSVKNELEFVREESQRISSEISKLRRFGSRTSSSEIKVLRERLHSLRAREIRLLDLFSSHR